MREDRHIFLRGVGIHCNDDAPSVFFGDFYDALLAELKFFADQPVLVKRFVVLSC